MVFSLNWIGDYASPVSISAPDVQPSTAFLRQMLVVLKTDTSETEITTLTQSPTTVGLEAVARAFTGGMSAVSYIKLVDLTTLNTFQLKNVFYTIIVIGFTPTEILASNYGEYDGVVVYATDSAGDISSGLTNRAYCYGALGLKACFTFGKFLSAPTFTNQAYTDSSSREETLEDKGIANQWFDGRGIAWGYDDQVGSRLITAFINGKGLSNPYILRELIIVLQTNSFNIMSTNVSYTEIDAKDVEGFNRQVINDYITAGLIISADYSVKLDPSNSATFIADLNNIETNLPIFKIGLNVQQ